MLAGGKVTGLGGTVVAYIQSGGTFDFNGGGYSAFFVKDGATLDWSLGGNSLIFAEPGATVLNALPGGVIEVNDLTLSNVPSNFVLTPEPSTLLLATLAGLGLVAARSKGLRSGVRRPE